MATIYLLSAGRKLKKVGLSSKPTVRQRDIQTSNGHEILLVFSMEIPDEIAANVERRAHWLLREYRRRGEWFAVKADIAIAAIEQAVKERGEGEKARSGAGRPSLNVRPVVVRLPEGIAERIDAVAGKNRRGEFIREAVERELRRRERKSE